MLFEEFVPLEYRQQLALPAKSRRRIPLLFNPTKGKTWKQAATLNGVPYQVGHVPRSPSFREVDFEGMLQGSRGTKIISLSNSNNRDRETQRVQSTVSTAPTEITIPPPPTRPAPTLQTTFTPVRGPSPEVTRQSSNSDDLHGEYNNSSMTTPSKKSRFRIPVPSPANKTLNRKSMVPAEYSTVEFETRMASYSDDEHNADDYGEPEEVKQRRRESRPDAWVDILVGSQARRMDDQSASPSDRRKATIDPDIASLEVAQVLASVSKERPSSPPSFPVDRVDRDYGIDQHIYDGIEEIEVVPGHRRSTDTTSSEARLGYAAEDEEMDEALAPILNARQMAREQRRMGYFDLHPERRPVSKAEDDPRARLAMDEDSDESTDSEEEDDDEPSVTQRLEPVEGVAVRPLPVPPTAVSPPKPFYEQPAAAQRIVPEIKVSTNPLPNPPQPEKPTGEARTPTSKTAALIEMYRERERTGSVPQPSTTAPVQPLNASRIPVRAGSLPIVKDKEVGGEGLSGKVVGGVVAGGVVAATVAKLVPSPTPSPNPSPPTPPVLGLPSTFEDAGRISPGRYVHGAPLHNVIEEDEEEEE